MRESTSSSTDRATTAYLSHVHGTRRLSRHRRQPSTRHGGEWRGATRHHTHACTHTSGQRRRGHSRGVVGHVAQHRRRRSHRTNGM
jgi:hypothetical protein